MAVNVDEFTGGASSIASPVLDSAGVLVGTCSVIGPTSRLVVRKDRIARWVKRAAAGVPRQHDFVPVRRG